jgi:hypothetical protein
MYQDRLKTIGEHPSVTEELFNDVSDIELKCKAVEKSVNEGYFTLPEALGNYQVSEIEYIPYLLFNKSPELKNSKKSVQWEKTIDTIMTIFDLSIDEFEPNKKKAFTEIKAISEKFNSKKRPIAK